MKNLLKTAAIAGTVLAFAPEVKSQTTPFMKDQLKVLNWVETLNENLNYKDSLANLIYENLSKKTNGVFNMADKPNNPFSIIQSDDILSLTLNFKNSDSDGSGYLYTHYKINDELRDNIKELNGKKFWSKNQERLVPIEIPLKIIGFDLEKTRLTINADEFDKKFNCGIYSNKNLDEFLSHYKFSREYIYELYNNFDSEDALDLALLIDDVIFTETKGVFTVAKDENLKRKVGSVDDKKVIMLEYNNSFKGSSDGYSAISSMLSLNDYEIKQNLRINNQLLDLERIVRPSDKYAVVLMKDKQKNPWPSKRLPDFLNCERLVRLEDALKLIGVDIKDMKEYIGDKFGSLDDSSVEKTINTPLVTSTSRTNDSVEFEPVYIRKRRSGYDVFSIILSDKSSNKRYPEMNYSSLGFGFSLRGSLKSNPSLEPGFGAFFVLSANGTSNDLNSSYAKKTKAISEEILYHNPNYISIENSYKGVGGHIDLTVFFGKTLGIKIGTFGAYFQELTKASFYSDVWQQELETESSDDDWVAGVLGGPVLNLGIINTEFTVWLEKSRVSYGAGLSIYIN